MHAGYYMALRRECNNLAVVSTWRGQWGLRKMARPQSKASGHFNSLTTTPGGAFRLGETRLTPRRQLRWLTQRDQATRNHKARYLRRGYSAGNAWLPALPEAYILDEQDAGQ